jgi:hypothetical protein
MKDFAAIAKDFAQALIAGDFDAAHSMLSPALQEHQTPETLRARYTDMLPETGEDVAKVQAAVNDQMDAWPEKEPRDAGWAYVSIFQDLPGATFVEAVTVIVTDEGRVRDLVWGRP